MRIALEVLLEGPHSWGCISVLAAKYKISRQFIYNLRNRLFSPFTVEQQENPGLDTDRKFIQKRLLCYGHSSLEGSSRTLNALGLGPSSIGSISGCLAATAAAVADSCCIPARPLTVMADEIFMNGKPVLVVAEAVSHFVIAATAIKDDIMTVCNKEANHPGIQQFQNIFRRHPERMFQWVKSPDIPSENNFAERGVRPSVIARKISFGSQSERGMLTRELLMTFLYTARISELDPKVSLEKALNMLCSDHDADIAPLFGLPAKKTADSLRSLITQKTCFSVRRKD